ncbi:MAG: hypothetical protein K2W96_28185, partial [Gemmataceae bacterium]|nr:hypothetical protein [Gemmataceae bacterium]
NAFLLPNWRTWAVSGRVLTAFIAFSLCLLSVPGWLQALPHYRHRLGLGVEYDEGLRAAAEQVARWRKEGLLEGEQRWFNLSPEAGGYFAWFCPGERTFLDQRLPAFGAEAARDFLDVREALEAPPDQAGAGAAGLSPLAWRPVFDKHRVRWLVFHSHNAERGLQTLDALYRNPDEWTPCFVSGKAALFAWRGPRKDKPLPLDPRLPEDFDERAFGPAVVPAPDEGPGAASAKPWHSLLLEGEAPPAASAAEARQHLQRFVALQPRYVDGADRVLVAMLLSSVVGRGASAAGTPGAFGLAEARTAAISYRMLLPMRALRVMGRLIQPLDREGPEESFALRGVRSTLHAQLDLGPVSSLYLSIRAARDAIKRNPEDPSPLFLLSDLYGRLNQLTREAGRTRERLPHVQAVRQSQIVAPLVSALRVAAHHRDRQLAHQMLANAFRSNEYMDLHVHHEEECLRLGRLLRMLPGVDPAQLGAAMEFREKQLIDKKKQMATMRGQFEVQSLGKPAVERAGLALRMGLADEAISLLQKAKPEEMAGAGRETSGLQLLCNLLLGAGRLDEARQLLLPAEGKANPATFGIHPLGMPAYDWFVAQLGAAGGDYQSADAALERLEAAIPSNPYVWSVLVGLDVLPGSVKPVEDPENLARFVALALGEALLRGARQATRRPGDHLPFVPLGLHPPHRDKMPGWMVLLGQARQLAIATLGSQADILAVRAALALEQGRLEDARRLAERSLDLGGGRKIFAFRSAAFASLILDLAKGNKTMFKP